MCVPAPLFSPPLAAPEGVAAAAPRMVIYPQGAVATAGPAPVYAPVHVAAPFAAPFAAPAPAVAITFPDGRAQLVPCAPVPMAAPVPMPPPAPVAAPTRRRTDAGPVPAAPAPPAAAPARAPGPATAAPTTAPAAVPAAPQYILFPSPQPVQVQVPRAPQPQPVQVQVQQVQQVQRPPQHPPQPQQVQQVQQVQQMQPVQVQVQVQAPPPQVPQGQGVAPISAVLMGPGARDGPGFWDLETVVTVYRTRLPTARLEAFATQCSSALASVVPGFAFMRAYALSPAELATVVSYRTPADARAGDAVVRNWVAAFANEGLFEPATTVRSSDRKQAHFP